MGFDGAKVALDSLNFPILLNVVVKCDSYANALAESKQFPESLFLDVASVGKDIIEQVVKDHPSAVLILVCAGFPCKDTSRLKEGRKNLEGSQSSLVAHVFRILNLIHTFAPLPLRYVVENAGMDIAARDAISEKLKSIPVLVQCGEFIHTSRPRLSWANHPFVGRVQDKVSFEPGQVEVHLVGPRVTDLVVPPSSSVHSTFPGCWPCFTGFRTKTRPFVKPRGLSRATVTAQDRWRSAHFPTLVVHFEDRYLLKKPDGSLFFPPTATWASAMGLPSGYFDPPSSCNAVQADYAPECIFLQQSLTDWLIMPSTTLLRCPS